MPRLNVLVPLAGEGRKLREQGYVFPKPLIEIGGKPMIEIVADNLRTLGDVHFLFVINQDDAERFALADVLRLVAPGCETIIAPGPTQGAACTALLAIAHIDSDDPLVIANGDQYIDADLSDFLRDAQTRSLDGSLIVFPSVHPKWSFARMGEDDLVVETAEKKPISRHATVGVYFFTRGSDFVASCQRMIRKDARVLDQFFVCPSFNELILAGRRIGVWPVREHDMYPLSTPEEIAVFAAHKIGDIHDQHRHPDGRRRLTIRPGGV